MRLPSRITNPPGSSSQSDWITEACHEIIVDPLRSNNHPIATVVRMLIGEYIDLLLVEELNEPEGRANFNGTASKIHWEQSRCRTIANRPGQGRRVSKRLAGKDEMALLRSSYAEGHERSGCSTGS